MVKTERNRELREAIGYIEYLLHKNGPDPEDYQELDNWYKNIHLLKKKQIIGDKELNELRKHFKEAYSTTETLQGFVYNQPHGYKGDFEIIDKIYQYHISEKLEKWDNFFQLGSAPKAVRNRKDYFKQLLNEKVTTQSRHYEILNLASGPCRDILEYFEENINSSKVYFDCVEIDENAVKYANQLLASHLKNIHFYNANIFKFIPEKKYPLIWSAGLFDYFNDKTFIRILKRFLLFVARDGELVIGNFHPINPSRRYMEFGLWHLHHRTEAELIQLAQAAGIQDVNRIKIEQEAEGVNLFMRIQF